MVSSSCKTIVFDRISTEMTPVKPNVVDINLDDGPVTRRKKHIAINKEVSLLNSKPTEPLAVPKTIVFPTSSTPIRHLFKTPITLTIGPNAHPFPLHLEALLACSPFFTAAFNPHYAFREALTSTLHLAEINVVDFEYFTQWLYRRSLEHESLEGPHPAYFRLIKLWKVADWLQVSSLKNAIVDCMCRIADATNSVPTPDDTRAIWGDDAGDTSQLGKLVLDLFVWKKTGHLIDTHPDSWAERFLRSLVGKLKERDRERERGLGAPWVEVRGRCRRYHVHDSWAEGCEGVGGGEGGEEGECAAVGVKHRACRKRRSAAPSPR